MELRPMTADELREFREQTISNFAAEKVRAEGVDLDEAQAAAEASWERAAPDQSDDHVIGRLRHDDVDVGIMWFVVRPEWGQPCVWLYDIAIEPEHRGKGLGRRAMALLEEQARARGVQTIGLHVFGHNTIARSLYEDLGFRATSIVMRKELEPGAP